MGKVDNRDLLQVFLDGDLEQTTTFASASASGTTDFLGVALNGVASGSVLGLAVSLKPYLSTSDVVKEKGRSVGVGARASAEVYGAEGSAKATFGQTKAEVSGKALSGCLSGTLGASLFKSGSPHPSLAAELDIAGTGLEGGASLKVGDAERNYRLRAKGEVLTTETEAGIEVGTSGIEVKAGNEAYVATGEVTGGITLFGVKVDATVEGKYGGAGAKAGAKIGDDSVEGTFGAGLGLGLGVKVKVDWSGAGKTFGSVRDQVGSWWNDLGKQVMN